MKPVIIIPTYNEVDNISKMITTIFEEVFKNSDISVLIVDGNSPDGTAKAVEKLQNKYPNLYLLKQKIKNGLASAYIEGFKWALNKDFNIFTQMDGDFQHPVELLPQMYKETENYDVIIGSRYIKGGCWDNKNNSFKKQLTSKLGSFLAQIILTSSIKDFTGGFNIYTRKALTSINLDKIKSKGYCFQIEMKYYAYSANLKIKEFPIIFRPRKSGKSKMDLKIIIEAILNIWNIKKGNL